MMPDGMPSLALLAARISLQEGEYQAALRRLDDALARSPGDAPLHKCRAEVFQRLHNGEAAARDAAEAVVLDPADAEAKAALGTALLGLGRTRDAIACLNEALAAEPGVIPWREALATALEAEEDVDTALRVLADGVMLAPDNVGLRNAAILVSLRRRDFPGAARLAEEARVAGIADACTFGMKGHALASMHDHDGASAAYQEALKLGPDDAYVRHLVMAAGALPSATRAPADYVATVFDGYADRFESHLISLGYTTPVRMRELLATHPTVQSGNELGPVLDLGCGTGLVALALSDLRIGPLTGVDLSAGMLRHARAKGLYAKLRQDDILAALTADSPERWPLILAADALVYFGALEEVFAAVRERLAPGGWFVFSLEELTPPDAAWALHRLGRYAHTAEYVQRVLDGTGLRLLRCDRNAMRREGGAPVPGLLIVAERPHHDN
jgi:predicted TPR repeat methyltransferase